MIPDHGTSKMLTFIGMVYLGKIAVSLSWQAFQGLRAHILSKVCPRVDFLNKYGKWAGEFETNKPVLSTVQGYVAFTEL